MLLLEKFQNQKAFTLDRGTLGRTFFWEQCRSSKCKMASNYQIEYLGSDISFHPSMCRDTLKSSLPTKPLGFPTPLLQINIRPGSIISFCNRRKYSKCYFQGSKFQTQHVGRLIKMPSPNFDRYAPSEVNGLYFGKKQKYLDITVAFLYRAFITFFKKYR